MEHHRTKDILQAMKLLGRTDIKNTLICTQLIQTKDDDFTCKTAKTIDQANTLVEAGLDYFCEIEGTGRFGLFVCAQPTPRGLIYDPNMFDSKASDPNNSARRI